MRVMNFLLKAIMVLQTIGLAFCCQNSNTPEETNPVNDDDQSLILDMHNDFRTQVIRGSVASMNGENLPAGINMTKLKWDPNLAQTAQDLADTCNYAHNSPEVPPYTYGVGQSLFQSKASNPQPAQCDFKNAIQVWFNEHSNFTLEQRISYDEGVQDSTHFSQLAWAKTSHVGCGCSNYNIHKDPLTHMQMIVCNYGPSGNVIGFKLYLVQGESEADYVTLLNGPDTEEETFL